MKIAGYIGELLYDYECVVIPGLGGFLTRDHTASIHPVKHFFKPPYREVVFNPLLRANDGLLLNFIARSERLSYQEAKYRLDRFVLKCLAVMEEGKRIHFRHVGSIYLNHEKQIAFEADENQNYLPGAFGMSGFVSPPVLREDFQHKIEKVFNNPPPKIREQPIPQTKTEPPKRFEPKRMIASRRSSNIKKQLLTIGVAASIMLGAWGYMNKHIVKYYYHEYSGYASLLPVFYASPNEYMIRYMEKFPMDMMVIDHNLPKSNLVSNVLKSAANNLQPAESYKVELDTVPKDVLQETIVPVEESKTIDTVTVKNTDIKISEPVQVEVQPIIAKPRAETEPKALDEKPISPKKTAKKYFIIAGAFKEKKNAENLIKALKEKNFEADYAGQTSGGLWRVCFGAFNEETTALQRMHAIKQTENENAWLLVI